MKDWMNKYIELLLASHNCLVIPGLGGFIVSDKFDITTQDTILLPQLTVAFNKELKYNDGLLYASLQQYESISYDKAKQKTQEEVNRIKAELNNTRYYKIGRIGTLQLNAENNIVFQPNEDYVHPSVFGLSTVTLNKLQRLAVSVDDEYTPVKNKNRMVYIAASIAIILFFMMPVFNQQKGRVQQANIIEATRSSLSSKIEALVVSNKVADNEINETAESLILPQVEKISARTYYIVIGSETNEYRRDMLLTKFEKDFSNLSFVEANGRYRIYAASFDDKKAAEDYLIKFREDNPKYETAWLYSKKN